MKIKAFIFLTSLLLAQSVLLLSCKKDSASPKTEEPAPTPQADPCDTVNYTQDIKPIVDANCLSCHGDNNPSAGFSLNSYDAVKEKGVSGKLKLRVIDGPNWMPKGSANGLPQAQKDLFACWIKNGFKKQ